MILMVTGAAAGDHEEVAAPAILELRHRLRAAPFFPPALSAFGGRFSHLALFSHTGLRATSVAQSLKSQKAGIHFHNIS